MLGTLRIYNSNLGDDNMKFKFEPPKLEDLKPMMGLEGPYQINHFVVYFDPFRNQYWDPAADHYLDDMEAQGLVSFINGKISIAKL